MLNKDLKETSQRAFKIGQINGKAFVISRRTKNLVNNLEFINDNNITIEEFLKDLSEVLMGINKEADEIMELIKEI